MLQAPPVLLVPRRLISGAREFLHQRRWGSVQSPGVQPSALQASLSVTNSQSLLKLMSMESVMPPNHHRWEQRPVNPESRPPDQSQQAGSGPRL